LRVDSDGPDLGSGRLLFGMSGQKAQRKGRQGETQRFAKRSGNGNGYEIALLFSGISVGFTRAVSLHAQFGFSHWGTLSAAFSRTQENG
jgi:hypothetical protein